MTKPAFIIAGTHSGVGKTTVTLAVMAGFKNAGFRVQGYKVGPDFIDPSYHELLTGFPSHNLDDWMMGPSKVVKLFKETFQNADVAVVEGVMGLFDGFGTKSDEGSTAAIAKLLNIPGILVIDGSHMARSVAAVVKGYESLDPQIKIAGVILNRVASSHHFNLLRESIEHYTSCPVWGGLVRDETLKIPQRHRNQ